MSTLKRQGISGAYIAQQRQFFMQPLDYLQSQPSFLAMWPNDDQSGALARVINAGVSVGRNILVNGTFDSSAGWTLPAGWSIAGGVLTGTAAGTTASFTIPVVIGKPYEITFTVLNYSSGAVRFRHGAGAGTLRSANGTYTETVIWASGTNLGLDSTTTFTGDIDNVSVRQLNIPASTDITPTQLLADGDMETAGVGAWTPGASATVTKQTGSPHGGSQVLRIARNGIASPFVSQTVLTTGNIYRATGWMRSDGSATPRITDTVSVLFTGTTSTEWQPFDVVFKAAGTGFFLQVVTSTGTQYAEFDDVIVSPDTYIRQGELLADGDMEASGVTAWPVHNLAVITKQTGSPYAGTQVLRVARNGTSGAATRMPILVVGKRYRIVGQCRSDGIGIPRVTTDSTSIFTGSLSGAWQLIDAIFVADGAFIYLQNNAASNSYVEFDAFSVVEVPPMSGINVNGTVLGVDSNTLLGDVKAFDGTNDVVNIYSADLNSAINFNEVTMLIIGKMPPSAWTDATNRYPFRLIASPNELYIRKTATNNTMRLERTAGGVTQFTTITMSPDGFFLLAVAASDLDDTFEVFWNDISQGVQTGVAEWVGNLSTTASVIGSISSAGSSVHSGLLGVAALFTEALDISVMQRIMTLVNNFAAIETLVNADYLLRVDFNTADTAPLTNPYVGEVGSIVPVQVDGQLSVSGGQLVFPSQATPTWGDLGFYENTVYARVAGRMARARITLTTLNQVVPVGWFPTAALPVGVGGTIEHALTLTSSLVSVAQGVGASGAVALPSSGLVVNSTYDIAIVLRETGAFYFMNGSTGWRLMWVDISGSGNSLSPGFSNFNAVGNLEWFNVRDLPAPFDSDYGLALVHVTSFTQSVGPELLTNGGFSSWTGDNPVGWTPSGEAGGNPEITERAPNAGHAGAGSGAANYYATAGGTALQVFQAAVAIGGWYEWQFNLTNYVSGTMNLELGGVAQIGYSSTGIRTGVTRAQSAIFNLRSSSPAMDFTLDDASAKLITPNAEQESVADAIHIFGLTVPASPVSGMRIELQYRIVDRLNYWVAYLRRNDGNTAWDFRLDSISAGTITNRINATGVGTPDAIMVIVDGALNDCYTIAAGVPTKRGGQINVSLHIAATAINTIYSTGTTPSYLDSFARKRADVIAALELVAAP